MGEPPPPPPSKLWADLSSRLPQTCPLHSSPGLASCRALGCQLPTFFPAAAGRTLLKCKCDHVTPAEKPSQGKGQGPWPDIQSLAQLSPCPPPQPPLHPFPAPHHSRPPGFPISLHTPLRPLALFHLEHSYSYCKAQLRGPSSKKSSLIS